jgi:hypothetical protein
MMHNRGLRQYPQHAPFQVTLATMHALMASRNNFHAERAEMKIHDLSGNGWAPNG